MVTRRAVLKGTAAGSIAAIASAHGVAEAADAGFGYGNLEDGALGAFSKHREGIKAYFKFFKSAAEVFYKENPEAGAVDVFFKFFQKGWSPVELITSFDEKSLADATAGFDKVRSDGATLSVKFFGESQSHYLNVSANGEYDTEGPTCSD